MAAHLVEIAVGEIVEGSSSAAEQRPVPGVVLPGVDPVTDMGCQGVQLAPATVGFWVHPTLSLADMDRAASIFSAAVLSAIV